MNEELRKTHALAIPHVFNVAQCLLPEGDTTIAQCFSFGLGVGVDVSPEGTADRACTRFSRPSGTYRPIPCANPKLKHWAIVVHPFGMSSLGHRPSHWWRSFSPSQFRRWCWL